MIRATVVGSVWATKRLVGVPSGAFLEVETDGGARLVAYDVLGSGPGEQVLIVQGSVASSYFQGIDALIIGSID